MATLRDEAKSYIPKQTKNISELPSVPMDIEIKSGEGINQEGKTFNYKYIEIGTEEYRVPNVVIGQIKDILEANPNVKTFKVKRSGEGKTGTRYTVIQLS